MDLGESLLIYNSSEENTEDDKHPEVQYNWSFLAVLVFVVAGTVGNVLVCLAVSLERRLQNVTNWFLVSLAMADLLVCVVVMPFGATAGFLGYWPLGRTWCNVYVTSDVLACSASILHMCCISLGRYMGIRSPLRTRQTGLYASKRMVAVRVTLVWLLALLISSPISALGLLDESNIMIGNQCVINNRGFAFFGSLAAFYVPMLIMVVSYALTVQLLRQKARSQHQNQQQGKRSKHTQVSFQSNPNSPYDAEAVYFETVWQKSEATQTPVDIRKEKRRLWLRAVFLCDKHIRIMTSRTESQLATPDAVPLKESSSAHHHPNTPNISSAAAVANEQKATKVLGVVFFTFVLCWAPFFVLNVVIAVCSSCGDNVPDRLVALCLWLGYVSSTINPLIYTIFNRTFKRIFIRLLMCNCRRPVLPVRRYSRCASFYDGLTLAGNHAGATVGLVRIPSNISSSIVDRHPRPLQ